jgi:hypothetical protein
MKHIHRLFIIFSAIVLSGVLSAPTAQAFPGDEKVFPASMCVRISGGTPFYGDTGVLFNASRTSSMTVVCPLVRDDVLNRWDNVEVATIDGHPDAAVRCQGFSNSRDGSIHSRTEPKMTVGPGLGPSNNTILVFPAIPAAEDRGSFIVRCTIPPNASDPPPGFPGGVSGLVSYLIAEED